MGADSQATEADGTRTRVEKIWEENGLLFGYTGMWAVRDHLAGAIRKRITQDGFDPHADRESVRTALCQTTRPVLISTYANYVPSDFAEAKRSLGGQLLVMGNDADGYWLLEINEDNTGSWYTDRGFHAVGSGSPAAQVALGLLQNYVPARLTLEQLEMLAFRTLGVSIEVLAQHLSEPVRLWASTGDGSFQQLTDTDLAETARAVEVWRTLERESLEEATASPVGDDLPPPVEA